MRIYLIGFMGCGKTRTGRLLSEHLGMRQIDLDHHIENAMFLSVPQLFEQFGEDGFRTIEQRYLKELSTYENVIISTGGGAPCYFDNMDVMNQTGVTVFLNPPPEKLAARLMNSKTERPLIKGKNEQELIAFIHSKLQERIPYYKKAKISFDQENYSIDQIAEMINDAAKAQCFILRFGYQENFLW